MSLKSTKAGRAITAVLMEEDEAAGNTGDVAVGATAIPTGVVSIPSSTQVNSSHVNVQSVPPTRSTGTIPKSQNQYTAGRVPQSVPSESDARRYPVRDARRKNDFPCQSCNERASDQMVQCDGCEKWFHYECVDVTNYVANVSWICPICKFAKDSTAKAINPPTSAIMSQSIRSTPNDHRQRSVEPATRDAGTGRPKSKASSVRSEARRIRELELQKLNEELELERKFLERKYAILKDNGSDTSTNASDVEKMSKIQEWVDETERLGEENDSGLVEEEANGPASNNSKQPQENQTPNRPQHNNRQSILPDQPGQPSQRTHLPGFTENQTPEDNNRPSILPRQPLQRMHLPSSNKNQTSKDNNRPSILPHQPSQRTHLPSSTENQTPKQNNRPSILPNQPGDPSQDTHQPSSTDNLPSIIPSMNPGTLVDGDPFAPGQRSTPLHQPLPVAPPAATGNDETICILNRSQIAARQAVSKDLPEFGGSPEDWPLFFSMFNSSTQMCGFSNEENMLRLRKCLKGKALEAVRCRLLHPSNVAGVMSTLKMLYGRPEAIVQAIIRKVRSLPPPSMEKLETVVNFALTVENLVATIQACEVDDFVYNSSLRYELVERLPSSLKMDWARFSREKPCPTLIDFSAWLYTMAEDASAVMISSSSSEKRTRENKKDGFLNFHSESESTSTKSTDASSKPKPSVAVAKEQCVVCKGTCPVVAKCKRFEQLSYDSKWAAVKECKLCRKCLRKHNGSCKQSKPCGTNGCEFLHHPLLHNTQKHDGPRSSPPTTATSSNVETETRRTDHSCNVHQSQSEVLFRIVPVMLYGPTKTIRTYAFVDDGSELTLIEQSLSDELGVQGPTKSLCLKWTGGTQKMEKQSQIVNLQISGVQNSKKYELSGVYTMSSLQIRPQTLLLAEIQKRYPYLTGLPLESYHDVSPRILIGLDHARLGHAIKSREGKDHEPIAVKTRLGWMVFGNCTGKENAERYVNYHSVQSCECNRDPDEELHKIVKAYFSLDSLGVVKPDKLLISQQDQRAQMLLETLTRRIDGRYESGLLWKYDDVRLPDSEAMALKRWRCLDNRMKKDPVLAEALKAKIDDHVSKGYVRKLTAEELQTPWSRVWYLPIFPVVNPNKPGKMRLVWDAAATVHGVSLNTFLLKGPDQLASLLSVLVQFREFRIAVCGDIREMFHQVMMRVDDQHCLRFFWVDGHGTEPSVYVVQVMTFGACCSPSTAQYVKNSNAKRFEQDHPEAVDAIIKRHYVDDMLVSVESVEEAIQLVRDVKKIHASAGFEIRNWISNSRSVLVAVNEESTMEKNLDIGDESSTEKVLGMWWDTVKDCFTYKVSARYDEELISGNRRPTKREVLRTLMMVFDPLGLIAHVLMFLKVLLQEIWRTSVGWDDSIEDPQYEKWLSWLAIFPQIASVEIPRCYRVLTPVGAGTVVQLHTFVDASENGFAAAVYLRFENGDTIECALVSAKTRVAPLKFLSIPRSELQAAVIGVRLAETISKSLSIEVSQRTFWTDSKDVLCWLRSDHRRYSQFVAFRVSEILETTDVIEWRWVPTKHNVADEGTKWKRAPNLASDSRWFRGPEFLYLKEEHWPVNPFPGRTTEEELRPHLLLHTKPIDPAIHPQDFSKWSNLLRVTAYVLRYINNLKRSCYGRPRVSGTLKRQDFIDAENHLFRRAQSAAFADEIAILVKNRMLQNPVKTIPRSSLLYQWCAFLDENDVLRVKGRTKACVFIDRDAVEPIILPRDHPVTRLIISAVHEQFNHQNHETVVNEILQRYRIPRLKAAYHQVRKDCQQCKILLAKPQPPAMADLPPARLAAFTRPFTHTGVDFFGPMLVSIGRRTEKRWGVLATCLTTRAIHLQIAHTLTTDSCVMTIRNIMARRGVPATIYSDRGTNFRAANKELQSAIEKLDHDALMKEFTSSHTEWSFNPPVTPHMGGAWERLIRSVKQNLERLQTSRLPTHEVLENALVEIENIVNSRPLTNIPIDGDDSPVLTPNHFLLGSANGLRSWVPLDDSPAMLRNSWKQSQTLADAFWKQWVRDYLPTITRKTKWFTPVKPITVGDVVIIVDPKLPRNCWPKGRVISTCPAPDGQVRWATVQTATGGIYERPAVSLAVLDVGVVSNTLQEESSRIPRGGVLVAPRRELSRE